jgi:protein-tyrosine kinase
MTKHSPLSLIERAAEAYDFAALLRAPQAPAQPPAEEENTEAAPMALPEPDPVAPVVDEIADAEHEEALLLDEPVETAPDPAPQPARLPALTRPAPASDIAAIDRGALAEKGFILPDAPVTGLAEEFRLVKRQLLAGIARRVSLTEEKRRTVLISSGQPGEGKSFCATNLALSLAGERDVEVLLIDGDVSKPDILATLGIASSGPGLVDALADPAADPEQFVIRTDVPGLSVLPAGRKANNVPELLASERTRDVLARLAAAHPNRIILFDSPPALMASSAAVLAGHVGQILVVVRADRTTEADLRETIELLSACDHVGLLLNGAALSLGGRRFGAYEGYGDGED